MKITGTIHPEFHNRASGEGTVLTLETVGDTVTTLQSVTALANGRYAFTDIPNGEYVVMPKKHGLIFHPASRPVWVKDKDVSSLDFLVGVLRGS